MGSLALSTGQAAPDHRDRVIASLEQENRDLKEQLEQMRMEAQQANKAVEQGVSELRKILFPLHQGLRLIFAEIDRIAPSGDTNHAAPQSDKKRGVWESWMKKLPGIRARLIESLLEHGSMTAAQLRVAAHCSNQAVYDNTAELKKLGLVSSNGGKYSLKEL